MSINEPIDIVFQNLTYIVNDSAQSKLQKKEIKKTILNNISGYFCHGRLTGIMGPSGAGKTSLLEILSGQSKSGEVIGNLYLNGNISNISTMKRISGFVFQDDIILRTMTVKEALYMSALLRLPETISDEEKKNKVNEMINLLHLEKCQDTIVGDSLTKGISGGERKRLSVGMEMISNPSIIFLDEPTSGLDTYSAYNLISNLKDLTNMGRTVISSIHQPSSDILRLFDDMIILNHGKIIYLGETKNLVSYFSSIGYQCPEYTNPSDYIFMNILNPVSIDNKLNNNLNFPSIQEKDKYILENFTKSGMEKSIIDKCAMINSNKITLSEGVKKYQASKCLQYKFLLKRQLKNFFRNKAILRTKLGQSIGLGLIIGLTFLNIPGSGAQAQIQDRNGSLFMSSVSQVLLPITGILALFSSELPVTLREISSGYYGSLAYYLSKMSIEIPMQIIINIITCTILYWLCLFQKTFKKYIIFVAIISLGSLCGLSIGTAIATASKDVNIAVQFAPFLFIPLILFSGLLINSDSIPPYFTWIQYLSPIRYMYQEVYKNEFRGLYYKGQSMEHYIDDMYFNRVSTALALSLLAGITLILLIFAYLMLFCTIKRNLSKTKYYLNKIDENNISLINDDVTADNINIKA